MYNDEGSSNVQMFQIQDQEQTTHDFWNYSVFDLGIIKVHWYEIILNTELVEFNYVLRFKASGSHSPSH
jgi:hypothetical protein